MGTRADHQITPMLSVRYDHYGDVAERQGPLSITMERHPDGDEAETASFLLRSELTREQLETLKRCVDEALAGWDERVQRERLGGE